MDGPLQVIFYEIDRSFPSLNQDVTPALFVIVLFTSFVRRFVKETVVYIMRKFNDIIRHIFA